KPNVFKKSSETGAEVVYDIKICKGREEKLTITVNGQTTPGEFRDSTSKSLPAVENGPKVTPDGGQGSITVKGGKDGGYTEYSVDFTPDKLPVTDNGGAKAHKRVRIRIWVVDCKDEDKPKKPDKPNKDKQDPA